MADWMWLRTEAEARPIDHSAPLPKRLIVGRVTGTGTDGCSLPKEASPIDSLLFCVRRSENPKYK